MSIDNDELQALQETDALTPKQAFFILEYMKDLNKSAAAVRAGYSERTAGQIGDALLKNVKVRSRIDEQLKAREVRTGVSVDRIVLELQKIAFSNLGDFVEYGPNGVTVRDADKVDGSVLAEVSESNTRDGKTRRIKLHDKMKALELLGRHMAMFVDKKEIDVHLAGRFAGLSDEQVAAMLKELGE